MVIVLGSADSSLQGTWKTAAEDLGIRVTAPARLVIGDRVAEFEVLVHDFGSRAGTVIVPLGAVTRVQREAARLLGVFLSELSPDAYAQYDRALLIETLIDWGWFANADEAPAWAKSAT